MSSYHSHPAGSPSAGGASMLSSAASFLMSSVPTAISTVSSRYSTGGWSGSGPGSSSSQNGGGPTFSRDLDRLYHVRIRPLLDAVDTLRGVLREESDIQLPTIVVVGDQSSGKSSVLEALSGVALPRGKEITTRCPLVLRLINTAVDHNGDPLKKPTHPSDGHQGSGPAGSDLSPHANNNSHVDPAPYAIISTVSPNPADGERVYTLEEIGARIEAATAKLAGRGIGVVATPIYLSVFRAHSPDLTLVDLPGITRNPIGDQPRDIYAQIKNMIYQFIRPETAVILNVIPATVDLPTSEGMMLSKEVDEGAVRTVGVVTKIDLAERGIRRKLEQGVQQLNLRLGVVAVRNRNQDENDRGVSFEVARQMESTFFKQHEELSALAQDFETRRALYEQAGQTSHGGLYLGTANLAQLLTIIQEQRIRTTLPKIKMKCRDMLAEYRTKYRELPSGNVSNGSEARVKIEHLLNHTMQQIGALVRGEHTVAKGDTKLHISPRLAELYATLQKDLSQHSSNFFSSEYASLVEEEVKENQGLNLPNFQSAQVFKGLMHREIAKLKQPASTLLDGARALVHHVLSHICKSVFHVYPQLQQRVLAQVTSFLDLRCSIIQDRLEELLMQEEEIFTLNAYYLDTAHKIKHAINERLYAIQQSAAAGSRGGTGQAIPTTITIPVNDLTITVHLAQLIRHAEKTQQQAMGMVAGGGAAGGAVGSAQARSNSPTPSPTSTPSVFGLQTLLNASGAATLDMQINSFVYTQIMHKRLCDALPLLIKFHLLRALTQTPATPSALSSTPLHASPSLLSLSAQLQKEFIDMPDKHLVECMKEDPATASKREALNKSIERMEKAMAVFDAL